MRLVQVRFSVHARTPRVTGFTLRCTVGQWFPAVDIGDRWGEFEFQGMGTAMW